MKLSKFIASIVISLFISATNAASDGCSTTTSMADIPADRLEAYKKAQAIINGNIAKGTQEYYQELFDSAKYIYVGRVKFILDKSDRAEEAKKDDSRFVYVKISKGWKSGKVRDIRLRIPKQPPLCDSRYSYKLKEKKSYLFFENRKGLITALSINSKTNQDRFSAEAIKLFGESDWYYSRNTTIHYNSKK